MLKSDIAAGALAVATMPGAQFLQAKGKRAMPLLAIGGEKSFGAMMATVMRSGASDVTEGVIPDSGHWIMEENPTATTAMVRAFLEKGR